MERRHARSDRVDVSVITVASSSDAVPISRVGRHVECSVAIRAYEDDITKSRWRSAWSRQPQRIQVVNIETFFREFPVELTWSQPASRSVLSASKQAFRFG